MPKGESQRFRIIHPFHPLCGQEFEVVNYGRAWGEDRVSFFNEEGRLISLLASWTSLATPDPFVVLAAGRSPFCFQDLVRLADLVARLKSAQEDTAGTGV